MHNVAFSFNPVYILLNQLLGAILDLGFRISDLLYRFALSFFIKLIRRRRTLNPNSKIQNPKFILNPEPLNPI
jgi:hypothetical protein